MSDKVHFSEEEMQDLTEEERAGLLEEMGASDADDQDEVQDDDDAHLEGDQEEDSDDQSQDYDDGNLADDDDLLDEDQDDDDDDDASDDDENTDAQAGNTTETDTNDQEDENQDDDADEDYEPLVSAPDVKERLEEQFELKRKIAEKFDDGEISAREKAEQEIQVDNEIYGLRRQQESAERSFEDAKNGWVRTHVPDFMKDNPQFKPNSRLTKLLNEEVIALQRGHYAGNPFHPAILEKAKKNLVKEWGEDIVNASATKAEEKPTKLKANKRPPMPPTLKNVPAAVSEDVLNDGGKFAALDRLAQMDTEKYEDALSKLTPEQLDQYMQSS